MSVVLLLKCGLLQALYVHMLVGGQHVCLSVSVCHSLASYDHCLHVFCTYCCPLYNARSCNDFSVLSVCHMIFHYVVLCAIYL